MREKCLTDTLNVAGDKCISKPTIEYGYCEFTTNRKSIENEPPPGRSVTATGKKTTEFVLQMVEDRRVTYEGIQERLKYGASSVNTQLKLKP